MCKKALQKTKAIFRLRSYLDLKGAKLLYMAFVKPAFNYCPLIWAFHGKKAQSLLNKTHRRALQAVYRNSALSFDELLELDDSPTVHVNSLRILMIEVFKSLHHLNPSFMWDLFNIKVTKYNLRTGQRLQLPTTKSKSYGTNSIVFRGSLLWNSLPNTIKSSESLSEFKRKIRNWSGKVCSCHLCI